MSGCVRFSTQVTLRAPCQHSFFWHPKCSVNSKEVSRFQACCVRLFRRLKTSPEQREARRELEAGDRVSMTLRKTICRPSTLNHVDSGGDLHMFRQNRCSGRRLWLGERLPKVSSNDVGTKSRPRPCSPSSVRPRLLESRRCGARTSQDRYRASSSFGCIVLSPSGKWEFHVHVQ